jgi:hypothetical protein
MLIVMEQGASEQNVQAVINRLVEMDFTIHRSTGLVHTVLGCVGPSNLIQPKSFEAMEGVKECVRITAPYKLSARAANPSGSKVMLGDLEIGGARIALLEPAAINEQVLRRATGSSLDDLLVEADRRLEKGNYVILQEADLESIPKLKKLTHLPVIAGPIYTEPIARAAIAAGADGLVLEVPIPKERLQKIAEAIGRTCNR